MSLKTKAHLAAGRLRAVPRHAQDDTQRLDEVLSFVTQNATQIQADLSGLPADAEVGDTGIRKSEILGFVSLAVSEFKARTASTKFDALLAINGVDLIDPADLEAERTKRLFA